MDERIDMAVFGPVPGFARGTIMLRGSDSAPRHGPLRALLGRMSVAVDSKAVDASSAAWREAYVRVGLAPDTVPPQRALAAWAHSPGGVPSQLPASDLVNAFSLQHAVPTAAYGVSGVDIIRLRPSRGFEAHTRDGDGPQAPAMNEIVLADDTDRVLARRWHGTPGADFAPACGTGPLLMHVDVLAEDEAAAASRADELSAALARLAEAYLAGSAEHRVLARPIPGTVWPDR